MHDLATLTAHARNQLRPFGSFDEIAGSLLALLQARADMSLWMLTRVQGNDWVPLAVRDRYYGVNAGDVLAWDSSFCSRMVTGEGPIVAARSSDVPAYASAPIGARLNIASYIGFPVFAPSGTLFGTFCGIDPDPLAADPPEMHALLQLCSRTLATYLALQEELDANERRQGRSILPSRDELTGLPDEAGWMVALERGQERMRRLPAGAGIMRLALTGWASCLEMDGQQAADELVARASRILGSQLRQGDVLARVAEDEFALLLPDLLPEALDLVGSRILQTLERAGVEAAEGWEWSGTGGDLHASWVRASDRLQSVREATLAVAGD